MEPPEPPSARTLMQMMQVVVAQRSDAYDDLAAQQARLAARERELAARAQRAVVRAAVAVVQSTVNDALASVYAAALESSMHD